MGSTNNDHNNSKRMDENDCCNFKSTMHHIHYAKGTTRASTTTHNCWNIIVTFHSSTPPPPLILSNVRTSSQATGDANLYYNFNRKHKHHCADFNHEQRNENPGKHVKKSRCTETLAIEQIESRQSVPKTPFCVCLCATFERGKTSQSDVGNK